LQIVDLRTDEESKTHPLENFRATSIPFVPPSPSYLKFSWNTTNDAILNSTFDWSRISSDRTTPVVIVGENSEDPRPLYASIYLFDLGFRRIAWVHEGAAGLQKK
jgi:hypothetical protein